jgi:hypothetical protein|tara:strand:+ start:2587 stop:3837 length:1251 start_codon:yes stop_codon:yes gene_type:complete
MSEIIDRLARCDTVLPQPSFPKFKLAHIGFTHHGDFSRNRDKTRDGHRYDSVGICNGVIRAGASCVRFPWDPCDLERMRSELSEFDGYIVRINPGQLSYPGVPPGAQKVFDDLMDHFTREGKPVWSSPAVQKTMGAKDALVKIKYLSCGLIDTKCYYDAVEFDIGFRTTAAFQPRVLKRNRGSAGEGVWLVWLVSTPYCAALGDRTLADDDVLELMEMCDNHVERHTVKEVVAFCVRGASSRDAGTWETTHPGGFFTVDGGGKQSVDGDDGNDDREDGVDDKNKPVSVDTDDVSRSASCADDVGAKNKLNADDTNSQTQSQQPACDQPSQQHPPHPRTVHVVDQRLLPRIVEGEVRLLLVRDELFQIIHKKPVAGGMSAVGTLIGTSFPMNTFCLPVYSPSSTTLVERKYTHTHHK